MGFWSDTKQLVSATGSALSDGMALLAEGATQLEIASHQLLLNTKIGVLERERARLGRLWFVEANAAKNSELLVLYSELNESFANQDSSSSNDQLRQLRADRATLDIDQQVGGINALNKVVLETKYSQPIEAINARRRLIGMLGAVLRLITGVQYNDLRSGYQNRLKELEGEIVKLEPQRQVTERKNYPSGLKQSEISRLDGKKNGIAKYWREDGSIKWCIPYVAGLPHGKAECFREGGEVLIEADFESKGPAYSAYSKDGELLASICREVDSFRMTINCFGESLSIKGRSKDLPKFKLFAAILATPGLLRFFWRARKDSAERDQVRQYEADFRLATPCFEELPLLLRAK